MVGVGSRVDGTAVGDGIGTAIGDGFGDGVDGTCGDDCPDDPNKLEPGKCGCGISDVDSDGDSVSDCNDQCAGVDDAKFAPGCKDAIPTVSQWGLVVLALMLMTAGKVYFGRRRRTAG